MKRHRVIIYSHDIRLITGRSESYARKVLGAIRKKLRKQKHQLITVNEFCEFMQVDPNTIQHFFESN